ncbi:MAG TPA: hypothetical protein VN455_07875 [Methanotrichaceae archaeon]|nr:hypothetical protein [Methanotrichaceae archaeon]
MDSKRRKADNEGKTNLREYEPPKAMRLGNKGRGAGQASCFGLGSSADVCNTGSGET